MSAIRGLHHKFRNNFRELHYRGGIFAKFAVGKICRHCESRQARGNLPLFL